MSRCCCETFQSEEPLLSLVRDGQDPDDDPGIRGALVVLLGGSQVEVKVLLQELVHVLLPNLGDRGVLVAV
jgi:hypothetical protein